MARKARINPLQNILQSQNAQWGSVDEALGKKAWQTAMDFGSVQAEMDALTTGVGLLDASARGTLVVSGADRVPWLHGLCTQDIKGLAPWQSDYACHIDIKGRVMADFSVLVLEDILVLDTEPGVARAFRRALRRFVVMEAVTLEDRSDWTGTLELMGPKALSFCETFFEGEPLVEGGHRATSGFWGDIECLLIPTARLGVPGVQIKCPVGSLEALWAALSKANARPCGWSAAEAVRIAHGVPRFGAELTEKVLFNEAELNNAVSFTKGCYLGQEVVERVDARGRLGRRLLGVTANADVKALAGAVIRNETRELGVITSSTIWGGRWLGMALVHRAANEPGTEVILQAGEQTWPAVLAERLEMKHE